MYFIWNMTANYIPMNYTHIFSGNFSPILSEFRNCTPIVSEIITHRTYVELKKDPCP